MFYRDINVVAKSPPNQIIISPSAHTNILPELTFKHINGLFLHVFLYNMVKLSF